MGANPLALLVDPHLDTRTLYAEVFASFGWDTLQAEDGAAAVGLAISMQPAAIISELRLPRVDGKRLIVILKSDPSTAGIPIVVVTGDAMASSVDAARAAGADSVLVKPITPDVVFSEVMDRVSRRSALIRRDSRALHDRVGWAIRDAEELITRKQSLIRQMNRYTTTRPPTAPPALACVICNGPLQYVRSYVGGVNAEHREQWDYYECPSGCGMFRYRQRTRHLARMSG